MNTKALSVTVAMAFPQQSTQLKWLVVLLQAA